MVKPIFLDNKLQEKFDTEGFVKITLLTSESVLQLNALFKNYFPNPSVDFYSSSYENDFPKKKEMSDRIGEILLPQLEKIFVDFKWFGSAFLSKGNGTRSEMPMHQDWTIVDETQFIALNIWTPLQDTNEENGTLEVIPGSHQWHRALRAPTLPFYFEGFQNKLKEKLTAIPALATEAVVLNQAVIHYSKANKTNDTRIAITTGIKSAGAPMIFHYWNKENPEQIEVFHEEDDFLNRFTDFHQAIFKRPTLGESMGKQPFHLTKISDAEFESIVNQGSTKQSSAGNASFIQKIRQWIKN